MITKYDFNPPARKKGIFQKEEKTIDLFFFKLIFEGKNLQNDFYAFYTVKKKNHWHIVSFSFCTIKLNLKKINQFHSPKSQKKKKLRIEKK